MKTVAKKRCHISIEKQNNVLKFLSCECEIVEIGVSYDMGFGKRGPHNNSSSRMGSAIQKRDETVSNALMIA